MSRKMRSDLDAAMVGVVLGENRRAAILEAMEKGEKPMKKVIRPMVVIAAALVALSISALALSPATQEMLDRALGGFARYGQEVEGVSATDQGIQIKVLSAITDTNKTKVYLSVKDLNGDRLSSGPLKLGGGISRPDTEQTISVMGCEFLSYDETDKTALFVMSHTGSLPVEDESMVGIFVNKIRLGGNNGSAIDGEWRLKTELEVLPHRRFTINETVNGLTEHMLFLSPLSVIMTGDSRETGHGSLQASALFAVWLKDGTVIFPENKGSMWNSSVEGDRAFDRWEFDEPVDVEQIAGVSVWYWYIPVNGDAAGPGYWLDELPESQ